MNQNNLNKLKKIILALFLIIISIIFVILLFRTKDSKMISETKEFIKTDTKILYIANNKNYSKECKKLLDKYEINYLYIDSSDLSAFDETKLERITNSKYLSNIVVIYQNGKIIDALLDYDNYDNLLKFLQKYSIIPEVIDNIDGIIDEVSQDLNSEYKMLYIPYSINNDVDSQDLLLKKIANQYSIDYSKINSYLLSKTQQEKLNTILQISKVDDQIVILIKNKKIIGSIRGAVRRGTYLSEMKKFKFIEETEDYFQAISIDSFKEIIKNKDKKVILIEKNECKYCDELKSTIKNLMLDNEIIVYSLNIENLDSETSLIVQAKLKELGYSDGFTTPLLIITENNKLLDYIIGGSSEDYIIDTFKENGIIK